jgi:UDP-glucose 4-epimerase
MARQPRLIFVEALVPGPTRAEAAVQQFGSIDPLMRALVTGGAGFIGSHLVERLLDEGHDVLAVDDLSSGNEENLPTRTALVRLDVCEDALSEEMARFRPEIVYHLAAQPSVVVSVADPTHDARVNVLGTINVLRASVAAGVRKVVYTSTGGAGYGDPPVEALPVPETWPWNPVSPYGISKTVAHHYLAFFRTVHNLSYTVLALSNVYGPRQDPHGEAGVVAIWSRRLVAGEPCVIFGDGEQTRDFVYVGDVIDAYMAAMGKGDAVVLNIATGLETSVNVLYRALADAAGVTDPPRYEPPRPGELRRISLAVDKARSELGWKPKTEIAEGLGITFDWFRENA